MPLTDNEAVDLGRAIVQDGRLAQLREEIGLTISAMSELLHVSWPTYKSWENSDVNLRKGTAARLGRFYAAAKEELKLLADEGINLADMEPLYGVATVLGIPQEELFRRYRNGEFEATDLGILGLWIFNEDVTELRK